MSRFLNVTLTNGQPIAINTDNIENVYPPEIWVNGSSYGYDEKTCVIVMTTKHSNTEQQRIFEVNGPFERIIEMMGQLNRTAEERNSHDQRS